MTPSTCAVGTETGIDHDQKSMVSCRFERLASGIEASSVIVSRALKIAAGGTAAEAEGRRMLSEKIEAGLSIQALAIDRRARPYALQSQ